MQVFVFQSEDDSDVMGFTEQRDGSNLPVEYGPWKPLGEMAMLSGAPLAGIEGGSDTVLDGIRRDGFCVTRSEVRVADIEPDDIQ